MKLPIYEFENAIVSSVRARGRLIVQAPTGSGKSTQIPQMLLRHGFLDGGEVVVLLPRRLATRMLAKRVAEEMGSALGAEAVECPWPEFAEHEVEGLVEQYSSEEWNAFR